MHIKLLSNWHLSYRRKPFFFGVFKWNVKHPYVTKFTDGEIAYTAAMKPVKAAYYGFMIDKEDE